MARAGSEEEEIDQISAMSQELPGEYVHVGCYVSSFLATLDIFVYNIRSHMLDLGQELSIEKYPLYHRDILPGTASAFSMSPLSLPTVVIYTK